MRLKLWYDGPPRTPIVIVIPGFMNETDILNPLKGWTAPTIQFAQRRGFGMRAILGLKKLYKK